MSLAKREAKAAKRLRAVEELVTTERTYVGLLGKLVTNYVEALVTNTSVVPKRDYARLFPSDIMTIYNFNKTFLEDLEKQYKYYNNDTTKISPIIANFIPYFRMYQNYVNNYEFASQILSGYANRSGSNFNQKFQDYEQNARSQCGNLSLSGLLILPIQRIPRYLLLLKEIIKNTESNHPDYKGLNDTLERVKEVSSAINERMKENEARTKVREVEALFGGAISLVAPARQFVKEGILCKIERKADADYMFFLFSDCVVYGQEAGAFGSKRLRFINLLPIDVAFRTRASKSDKVDNCFEIHSSVESFLVIANDADTMKSWLETLHKAKGEHLEKATVQKKLKPKEFIAAPLFIPDDWSDVCMVCGSKFTFMNRRHHCYYCGLLCCSKCSTQQLPDRANKSVLVRVCDECYHENIHKFPNLKRQQARSTKSTVSTGSRKSGGLSVANPVEASSPERKGTEYSSNTLFNLFRQREESTTTDASASNASKPSQVPKSKGPPPRSWPPPSNATPATEIFEKNQSKPMPSHNTAAGSVSSSLSNASKNLAKDETDSKLDPASAGNAATQSKADAASSDASDASKDASDAMASFAEAIANSAAGGRDATAPGGRAASQFTVSHPNKLRQHDRYQSVMNFIEMDVQPQMAKLAAENEKLRKQVSHLTGSLDDAKKEVDHFQSQIEQLQEQLRQKEFSEDAMKLAKMEQENRDIKLQLKELHDMSIQHAELQQQNQTVMEINQALQRQIGGSTSDNKDMERLQQLVGRFNNEHEGMIRELKREKEELLQSLKESEKTNQELTNEIVKLQKQDLKDRKKNSVAAAPAASGVSGGPSVNISNIAANGGKVGVTRQKSGGSGGARDRTQSEVDRLRAQVNDLKQKVGKIESRKGSTTTRQEVPENKKVCAKCQKVIEGRPYKASNGKNYHRECHCCDECGKSLLGKRFGVVPNEDGTDKRMCEECTTKYNDEVIRMAQEQEARRKKQNAAKSRQPAAAQKNGAPATQTRQVKKAGRVCTKCSKEFSGSGVRFPDGKVWCQDCAVCDSCRKPIWNQQWAPWSDGKNYCMPCLSKTQFG